MNANMENTIYGKLPVVAGLNKVQGFDPRKFMRRVVSAQTKQEAFYLDLKFKKLWFRLACPKGRIKTTALKITEQLAIIEAKVYFDRNDKEPAACFIAQRNAKDTPGALYIETAQYAAVDQALVDAGFGLQFADVGLPTDTEPLDAGIPVANVNVQQTAQIASVAQAATPVRETSAPAVTQTAPDQRTAVIQETAVVQEAQTPANSRPVIPVEQAVQVEAPPAAHIEATPEETPAAVHAEAVQEATIDRTPIQAAAQPETAVVDIPPVQSAAVEMPAEELVETAATGTAYSGDMPVEEICRVMTVEDAENYIVDVGTCKGWTLGQVAQRRSASLKWYLNGYQGDNNILRAGAKLLLEQVQAQLAS